MANYILPAFLMTILLHMVLPKKLGFPTAKILTIIGIITVVLILGDFV